MCVKKRISTSYFDESHFIVRHSFFVPKQKGKILKLYKKMKCYRWREGKACLAFLIIVFAHSVENVGSGIKRKSPSGIVWAVHFTPFYPKEGNLFVYTHAENGYSEDYVYKFWKAAAWGQRKFRRPVEQRQIDGGFVVVRTDLYSVYLQITFYVSSPGRFGATLSLSPAGRAEELSLITCVASLRSNDVYSCFSSGMFFLSKNDIIYVKPSYRGGNFSMVASNTFWGMRRVK